MWKNNYPRLSIRMQLINLLRLSKTRALILISMKLVNYLLTFFQLIWHSVIGTLWWHITAHSRYFAVILCQSLKWTPRVSPHKQATGCPCPFRHLWFPSWPLCGIYSYRTTADNIRIAVVNANSVKGKKPEIAELCNSTQLDIMVITETKIDSTINSSEFLPQNYNGHKYVEIATATVAALW